MKRRARHSIRLPEPGAAENAWRAARAKRALTAFVREERGMLAAVNSDDACFDAAARDLISDLLHLVRRRGLDPAEMVEWAYKDFQYEVLEETSLETAEEKWPEVDAQTGLATYIDTRKAALTASRPRPLSRS